MEVWTQATVTRVLFDDFDDPTLSLNDHGHEQRYRVFGNTLQEKHKSTVLFDGRETEDHFAFELDTVDVHVDDAFVFDDNPEKR